MYVRTNVYIHTHIYLERSSTQVHIHTHTHAYLERSDGRRVVDVCLSTRACAVVVFARVLEHFSVDVRRLTRKEADLVLEEVVSRHVHE